MSQINVKLATNLQTSITLSGKDNAVRTAFNEPREDMNPGELLAGVLGACMLTMVGFLAASRWKGQAYLLHRALMKNTPALLLLRWSSAFRKR